MTVFVEARDHVSGALMARLPIASLPTLGERYAVGLSRKLRMAFVSAGQLTPRQAESADFELRERRPSDRD
jgi:hypothetical protein